MSAIWLTDEKWDNNREKVNYQIVNRKYKYKSKIINDMNDRDYQITFCKKCLNRKMDFTQGLLCGLTSKKANFEKECPNFSEDTSVKQTNENEKSEILTPEEVKNKLGDVDYEKLRLEQNLLKGIIAGIAGGALGAFLWVVITVITMYQVGYMAIAIGIIVGFAIKIFGKGVDKIFGICGAIIAVFACLVGNFFSVVVFTANEFNAAGYNVGYFEILKYIKFSAIIEVMKEETFRPVDLLFYCLAITAGYKFSFRKITEKDIENLGKQ